MTVDLKPSDLISLIRGCTPSYELMEHPLIKPLGTYTGGFRDDWSWGDIESHDIPEGMLWKIYKMLKGG